MRGVVAVIVGIPALALFLGTGMLFWNIGQTWDSRSTDMLIAGMISVCAGGLIVLALVVGLVVGVPMALRVFEQYLDVKRMRATERMLPPPGFRVGPGRMPGVSPGVPMWAEGAPQIEDKAAGSFQTLGEESYDPWGQQGSGQGEASRVIDGESDPYG